KLHLLGLGQSSIVFDVFFLSLTCLYARLGFQDLVFDDLTSMLFFIARGGLHGLLILFRLLFYIFSLIMLHISLLSALLVWIVFSSVYALWAWNVVSTLKLVLLFLGGRLPFSIPQ
ncbi:LOW QUALITY PROTEIN: hypothetical protein HID58_082317, partial [Brassica napus]